jgi:hypothetical protein
MSKLPRRYFLHRDNGNKCFDMPTLRSRYILSSRRRLLYTLWTRKILDRCE